MPIPKLLPAALAAAGLLALFLGSGRERAVPATPSPLLAESNLALRQGNRLMNPETGQPEVYVRVLDKEGRISPPVRQDMVVKTDEEWRAQLTPEQFRILRAKGTERPFCGGLLDNKDEGFYLCGGCSLPLFETGAKFDSGTGWPSFFQPVAEENILEAADFSHGMNRVEVVCARCESHLGHVFEDGPRPTGMRFCINGESMDFVSYEDAASRGEEATPADVREAVLAGGCFWCVEAVFRELDGVVRVESGYSGGTPETANYQMVSRGTTRHAEAVRIFYDADRVNFEDLLRVHFATHDPTTLNRQGADVGPQYRSAIFPADDEQRRIAEAFIADLGDAGVFGDPIVTTIEPLEAFFRAEEYHQNFVCRNPRQGYVRAVALPKVEKLRKSLSAEKAGN